LTPDLTLPWMTPIVTDRVAWSVCRALTVVGPARTAEPIEMSFGLWTWEHVVDGGPELL